MKWKPRKITPELAEQMRKLKAEGKSYAEIAKMFNVRPSTVQYHVNAKYKQSAIMRARKSYKMRKKKQPTEEELARRREYWRMYRYNRYHSDEEFRRRVIELAKRYQQKKRHAN